MQLTTKKLIKTIVLFIIVFTTVISCKDKKPSTDNLFKYKDYIYYTTSGRVSVTEPIKITMAKDVDSWEANQEIDKSIFRISPSVKGKLYALNKRTLIFQPEENLKSNTEYTVTVTLGKLFTVKKGQNKYKFSFKTIAQNFNITTKNLQSYSKEWQFLEGNVQLADVMSIENVKQLINASQKGKKLDIKWENNIEFAQSFLFKIDSIKRFEDDSEIDIKWNGNKLNIDNKGENTFKILGKNNFSVIRVNVEHTPELHLQINFSDPLKKQQDFSGLVHLKNAGELRYVVDGNLLKVYPSKRIVGNVNLEVFKGIKNSDDYKLKNPYTATVTFEQLKPKVRLISNGVILPNSSNLNLNFEAVNLKAVDVRVIKIYEKNVLQFLQNNNLNSNNQYEVRRVGRRIAKKTIQLIKNNFLNDGKFKTYSVDLSKLINTEPGAIYRVEFSIKKEYALFTCDGSEAIDNEDEDYYEEDYYYDETKNYTAKEAAELDEQEEQYWDNLIYNYRNYDYNWNNRENPCKQAYYDHDDNSIVSQNILASNLGVIVKKGTNKNYYFAVTDILTTKPVSGAKIRLYNYQQQEILSTTTDNDGFANIDESKNAYFAIVSNGTNFSYLKLEDGNSLSLSKFDVSGKRLEKGLLGYIYGERGVWRPGDTLHLNFILNDKANKLPKNHPVRMEVTDAKQKLIYKKIITQGINGFYKFDIVTSDTAPTGSWNVKVSVGGATFYKVLKVETIKPNRLKIKINFTDEIFSAKKPIQGKLAVKWLHGAPAKNLKTDVKVKFSNAYTSFKNYPNYEFSDPTRTFNSEELTIFDGILDADGNATISKEIDFGNKAPGMLRASFFTRTFEKGGDYSMDVFSKNYAPYTSFVGLKSPKSRAYGSFFTDEDITFDVVTVDDKGNPIKRKGLEVKIYEIKWRWWWNSSYDDLASYVSNSYHKTFKSFKINTDNNGKGNFKINVPNENGNRYLIRIYDPKSGHATGRTAYFYKDWWKRQSSDDPEAAKMLVFSSDKDKYNVGETARITFPSGTEGRALISIENGSEVLHKKWVKTKKGETVIDIPIDKNMAPNVFVNISLLQPHAKVENDLPLRLYGIIPLLVEDPNTKIQPIIDMPKSLKPEENFTLKIKEKNGKPMTYTIAIVDEGLLDITRFKTPNAWTDFYKKQALGVKTWDLFDAIIGAYSGSIEQVYAIGGDGEAKGKKSKKANRFKPVVITLGPFTVGKNKSKSHIIKMPKYIGSVRTMVVSGDNTSPAYGSAEETTPVKKPLMVLATLPRKLSPGEKVTLPVAVFAMDKKIKNAKISLKLSKGIKIIGKRVQTLNFDKPDEKMVYFDLDVSEAKGISKIEVIAQGNGEKSSYEVEIDVVNPNPITNKVIDIILEPNASKTIDFKTFGIKGSNKTTLEFSTLPPMNFGQRMQYLIQYPHGCVEQTTSSAFPQLYLGTIFDLTVQKKQEMEDHVKMAIKKLSDFQTPSGGLSYWRGQNDANDWGTSYGGHFMLEAAKKGFVLPLSYMSNWLKYQKRTAKDWRASSHNWNTTLSQAYRLYTLALANHADLSSMNRLREENLSNDAKWRLAAAYAIAGQKEVAVKLSNQANIDFKPYKYDYYSYGSVDRNRAMALETMLLTNDEPKQALDLAKLMAKNLSTNRWMSTQSTAYSLYALAKMVTKNGGKGIALNYNANTQGQQNINTSKAIAQRKIKVNYGTNSITLKNTNANNVFVRVLNSGILPLGREISETRGLKVSVKYKDEKGNIILVSELKQGADFMAQVTVENTKGGSVNDIALTQIFPSGWEIVNTRFTDYGNVKSSSAEFTDIRDDRVNFYFSLGSRKSKTFNVLLNASYLGKYYLFGVQAEAMYDNDYFTRTKGQWITVVK
ncbi:MAG: MG2 domain-containing protein [Flavobacteriaceae bacterium]|nr:MG2 domain-containing protein [Flavobacteriaceae bacterium]